MHRDAPDDFGSFVTAHEAGLRSTCQDIAGHDHDRLAVDLLAIVAMRWHWWPRDRRGRRGAALLARLLRREDRIRRREVDLWRPDHGGRPGDPQERSGRPGDRQERSGRQGGRHDRGGHRSGRIQVLVDTPVPGTPLPARAWRRARSMRRGRVLSGAVALALLAGIVVIGPRPPTPANLPGPAPAVAVPAGVTVLPAFAALTRLPRLSTALPPSIDATPASTMDLAAAPMRRAMAAVRSSTGPLLVVADDTTPRTVDQSILDGSRLLVTSLSPDGARIALVTATGLLVIDVTSGAAHPVAAPAIQPATPMLTWRTARTVLLPHGADAVEVNVDTGAVTRIAGVTGIDVVAERGTATGSGALRELTAALASITLPPRIRTRTTSGTQDRPIFGPPWIGDWTGTGWSTQDILARPCSSGQIALPSGQASAALGAVNANGLYAGTLVGTDSTTIDILGFTDPDTVLVGAYSATETDMLAWSPRTGALQLVTTVSGYVRVSVPDLLVAPS